MHAGRVAAGGVVNPARGMVTPASSRPAHQACKLDAGVVRQTGPGRPRHAERFVRIEEVVDSSPFYFISKS